MKRRRENWKEKESEKLEKRRKRKCGTVSEFKCLTTIIAGADENIDLHEEPLNSHDYSPSSQVSTLQDDTDQTGSHLSHRLSLSKQRPQLVCQTFTENGCLLNRD